MENKVLKSVKIVSKNAEHVSFDEDKIKDFAKELENVQFKHWSEGIKPPSSI